MTAHNSDRDPPLEDIVHNGDTVHNDTDYGGHDIADNVIDEEPVNEVRSLKERSWRERVFFCWLLFISVVVVVMPRWAEPRGIQ